MVPLKPLLFRRSLLRYPNSHSFLQIKGGGLGEPWFSLKEGS